MRILALLIVILGSAARVARWFADRPLWLDEQMIAINLRDRGFAGLATDLAHDQSAPIGWLWSERLVLLVLGDGGRALRLLPLLFGIGTLVLAYYAGRRPLGPGGTLALVTLLAVNGSLMRYSTEVKQYSADAFTVLLLLTLALLAIRRPAGAPPSRWAGPLTFWAAAAVSGLFSTAAIMATPGIALVMLAVAVHGCGLAATARRHAAGVALWLVSLGAHYVLALRFAIGDTSLAALNARLGFPPEGLVPTARWLMRRPFTLAGDPIGVPASLSTAFWTLAALGILAAMLLARRPSTPADSTPATLADSAPATPVASAGSTPAASAVSAPVASAGSAPAASTGPMAAVSGGSASAGRSFWGGLPWRDGPRWAVGLVLAAPVVTAFAAAAVHAVPLYGRFAVQLLPSLFLAIAITTDLVVVTLLATARALGTVRRPLVAIRTLAAAAGAAMLAAIAVLAVAPAAVTAARPAGLTNGFDDRSAVDAIAAAHRPGDLLLVTPSAWPAVKWYAGATTFAPVFVLWTGCRTEGGTALTTAVPGYSRLLVYAGMQAGGTPGEATMAAGLADYGTVSGPERFGKGALYTVTLQTTATTPATAGDTCLQVTTPRE